VLEDRGVLKGYKYPVFNDEKGNKKGGCGS